MQFAINFDFNSIQKFKKPEVNSHKRISVQLIHEWCHQFVFDVIKNTGKENAGTVAPIQESGEQLSESGEQLSSKKKKRTRHRPSQKVWEKITLMARYSLSSLLLVPPGTDGLVTGIYF